MGRLIKPRKRESCHVAAFAGPVASDEPSSGDSTPLGALSLPSPTSAPLLLDPISEAFADILLKINS
jgi:hypothetical protein